MDKFILDLKLFDDDRVINKTTSNTPGNDLTAEMKTFYEKVLLENAKPNLVHQQFGKKVPIPRNSGKTVEFRKYKTLPKALTPLTEGVTPQGDKLSVSTVVATCEQYGNYVMMTDQLDLYAIDNNMAEATELIADNAGATLDTVTRNELHTGTNVLFAENATTHVTPVSRADLTSANKFTPRVAAKAAAIMKKNNVPTYDGFYVCIIHPYVEFDLITNPEWVGVQEYTDSNVKKIFEGEIGRLYKIRFVVSSEAKVYKSTGGETDTDMDIATYGCLVIGKGAYGVVDVEGGALEIIAKQKGSAGSEDPLNQRATVGWKITGYTAKILQEERLLRVECASDFSDVDDAN